MSSPHLRNTKAEPQSTGETEYAKGSLAWFRDPVFVWRSGTIIDVNPSGYTIESRDGDVVHVASVRDVCLRNADEFSVEGLVSMDDLTRLVHLNEASVLHSLQVRFDVDKIYTYTGPILIALNPFKRIRGMYADSVITEFAKSPGAGGRSPHIFGTAGTALGALLGSKKSQTILISGESGAGKTESTKYVLKYLSSVAHASTGSGVAGGPEHASLSLNDKVVASNPVLEALGNARTLRNDNSSRFGKFIRMQIESASGGGSAVSASGGSSSVRIASAGIDTYLLEKTRVVNQLDGERNFHIFFQICAAAGVARSLGKSFVEVPKKSARSSKEKQKETRESKPTQVDSESASVRIHLPVCLRDHSCYRYLTSSSVCHLGVEEGSNANREDPDESVLGKTSSNAQGSKGGSSSAGSSTGPSGIDDYEEFCRTVLAMIDIGFSVEEVEGLVHTLAVILEMGNVEFEPSPDGEGSLVVSQEKSDTADSGSANGSSSMGSSSIGSSALSNLSHLLGDLDVSTLSACLTTKLIVARGEKMYPRLNVRSAKDSRDSLAMHMYRWAFDLVVSRVNRQLGKSRADGSPTSSSPQSKAPASASPQSKAPGSPSSKSQLHIGVLDIFGFECFAKNSLEHLLINYTNERLQHFFNTFVFLLEQALYVSQGVPFISVDFPDNSLVIAAVDTIPKTLKQQQQQQGAVGIGSGDKGTGAGDKASLAATPSILSILEDECALGNGDDTKLGNNLTRRLQFFQGEKVLDFPKLKPGVFVVNHYAGSVEYTVTGFVDKNRDNVSSLLVDTISQGRDGDGSGPSGGSMNSTSPGSRSPPLKILMECIGFSKKETSSSSSSKVGPTSSGVSATISGVFRRQLSELLGEIEATEPHFVRCVKPNAQNLPDVFDRPSVCEQLRYAGMLQVIQVSRASYPVRMALEVFTIEFGMFDKTSVRGKGKIENILSSVTTSNSASNSASSHIAIGKTLIFFKKNEYERISALKSKVQHSSALCVQKNYLGHVVRKGFVALKQVAIVSQAVARQGIASRLVKSLLFGKAATTVQSVIRRNLARASFLRAVSVVVQVQSIARCSMVSSKVASLHLELAAETVVGILFGLEERRKFQSIRKAAVSVQSTLANLRAVRVYDRMRSEDRDVALLHSQLEALRRDNGLLSQRVESLVAENEYLGSALRQLESVKEELESIKEVRGRRAAVETSTSDLLDPESEKTLLRERLGISLCDQEVQVELAVAAPEKKDGASGKTETPRGERKAANPSRANSPGVSGSQVVEWVPPSGVLYSSLAGTKGMQRAPGERSDVRPVQELQDSESAITCLAFSGMSVIRDTLGNLSGMGSSAGPMGPSGSLGMGVSSSAMGMSSSSMGVSTSSFSGLHGRYFLLAAGTKEGSVVVFRIYKTGFERAMSESLLRVGDQLRSSDQLRSGDHSGSGSKQNGPSAGGQGISAFKGPSSEWKAVMDAAKEVGSRLLVRGGEIHQGQHGSSGAHSSSSSGAHSSVSLSDLLGSDYGNVAIHCRLIGHTRAVTSVYFSPPNDDIIVSTSIDKSVRFWQVDTGDVLKVFTDSCPVPVAAYVPSAPSTFVSANANAVIRLVDSNNGSVVQKLKVDSEIRALRFDNSGSYLFAGTKSGCIHVLECTFGPSDKDRKEGAASNDSSSGQSGSVPQLLFLFKCQLSKAGITCLSFVSSALGSTLVVNSADSSVSIVDCIYNSKGALINLNVRQRLKVAHALLPLKSCYVGNASSIVCETRRSSIGREDSIGGGTSSGVVIDSLAGHLVSGSEDKSVYVYSMDKAAGYKGALLRHHDVPVVTVACNGLMTLLASGDSLGRIVLWRRIEFSHLEE